MQLQNTVLKSGENKMVLIKTYWDFDEQVEKCEFCDEIVLDSNHECKAPHDEENYSSTLKFGFDLLKIGD